MPTNKNRKLLESLEEIIERFELIDTQPLSWNTQSKSDIYFGVRDGIEMLCELMQEVKFKNYGVNDFIIVAKVKPVWLSTGWTDNQARHWERIDDQEVILLIDSSHKQEVSYYGGKLRLKLYKTEEDVSECKFQLAVIDVSRNKLQS